MPPVNEDLNRRQLLFAAVAGGMLPYAAAQTPAGTTSTSASGADVAAQEAKEPPLPAVGAPLTLPAVELLDGRRFEPVMAEGRVTLVYWWASWCPFCALTSPYIDKLWQAQQQRGVQGLQLLTFSIDKRAEEARAHLARKAYAWPAAWVSPALARSWTKPKGLPVTLVRGRDGRVLQAEAGQLFPEDVEALARHVAG